MHALFKLENGLLNGIAIASAGADAAAAWITKMSENAAGCGHAPIRLLLHAYYA